MRHVPGTRFVPDSPLCTGLCRAVPPFVAIFVQKYEFLKNKLINYAKLFKNKTRRYPVRAALFHMNHDGTNRFTPSKLKTNQ